MGKGPRCPSEGTRHSHPKSQELSLGRCHERPEGGYGAHACELNVTGTHTHQFQGPSSGAVTTDTFPFDFPGLYPKSNHNVNTKSKFKSPLSHRDQEHAGTVVQIETCPHTPGESSTQLLRESHETQSDAERPRRGRVSWGQAQGSWWGADSYVDKPTPDCV